jgi:hypothetical protein
MTQRIQGDQFGRPACLAAFAVSVGVLFAAITGSAWPPRAGSVWPPFDTATADGSPTRSPPWLGLSVTLSRNASSAL